MYFRNNSANFLMLDANLWAEPDQQGQKGTTTRKGSGARSTTAAATTTCRTPRHSGFKRLKSVENNFVQSGFMSFAHTSMTKIAEFFSNDLTVHLAGTSKVQYSFQSFSYLLQIFCSTNIVHVFEWKKRSFHASFYKFK